MMHIENWRFHSIRLFNVKLELILALGILISLFLPMSINTGCEPLDLCFSESGYNNSPHVAYPFLEAYKDIKKHVPRGDFRILFFYIFTFLGPLIGFFIRKIETYKLVIFLVGLVMFLFAALCLLAANLLIYDNAFKNQLLAGYYFFAAVSGLYLFFLLLDLLAQLYSGLKKAVYLYKRVSKQEG